MARNHGLDPSDARAQLRFSVIGHPLASPPPRGELDVALDELSLKDWTDPVTERSVRFSKKAIERWYYVALGAGADPMGQLRKKRRRDAGKQPSISEEVAEIIHRIRRDHYARTIHVIGLQSQRTWLVTVSRPTSNQQFESPAWRVRGRRFNR